MLNNKKEKKNIFNGALRELKKVIWPEKKQLLIYTFIVIILIVIFSILVGFYDFILTKIIKLFLNI